MRTITFETIKRLVPEIRTLALAGQSDTVLFEGRSDNYMHEIDKDIHWQTAGEFLIVYIESYGSDDSYSYRLYRCSGYAAYDRRTVLEPDIESDDCTCLFNLEECWDEITYLYLYNPETWYEDYKKTVSGLLSEE